MLIKLAIDNYALIDQLEIDFETGFSVITGETGSGKSILLGALSLVLGQRADTSVLLDNSRKCIVEAAFRVDEYGLEEFFSANELDFDETAILRREISSNGKSRAFINDTPVNLPVLKELGDKLVNIHSQHSIITLNDEDFQLAVVDSYAGTTDTIRRFRTGYHSWLKLRRELEKLVEEEQRARSEHDYILFQFEELEKAMLKEGEQADAEARLSTLVHAEEIKNGLFDASQLLSSGDTNTILLLTGIIHHLTGLSKFNPHLNELNERVRSNLIDLKDIASALEKMEESVNFDPGEHRLLTERLDLLYRLEKKHSVRTVEELIAIRNNLDSRLSGFSSIAEKIQSARVKLDDNYNGLKKDAGKLSARRRKAITPLEKEIQSLLTRLGMPDARFCTEMTPLEEIGPDGLDRVRFLFSSNKGIPPDEVVKIASGGELSRLMLSIKSMISRKNLLPTVIFDEIDNGVSGEIAGKVGAILKKMSEAMQVIVITHLPQIAGKGSCHYLAYKDASGETTHSHIRKLKQEERITEIAKMLSSETPTNAALRTAKELLAIA